MVLVGPSGSGKSTWAETSFSGSEIVGSDSLRALVGIDADDQTASTDAFFLLDEVVKRRLARRLTTVIDTTGLDADTRVEYLSLASKRDMATYAVCFDTPVAICRARNEERPRPIPKSVHSRQFSTYKKNREAVSVEGFGEVMYLDASDEAETTRVRRGPAALKGVDAALERQTSDPTTLRFGLQVSSFTWNKAQSTASRLVQIAEEAESAGFANLWVMDHLRQIPQVGRAWEDMLESYTTLAFLAASTTSIGLGALVTAVPYRNPAILGKTIATLDVLSEGRAICGLGLGWFAKEAEAYGIELGDVMERYELLEDTLQLLPLLWGPGNPEFVGKRIRVPEAMCYPRPLQDRIPILIGGSGERRTLRLVARYGDYCNLFGGPERVRHKVNVLSQHCLEVGRDPQEITVSHLGPALVASDQEALTLALDRYRPTNTSKDVYARSAMAGTVDEQIGRYRELAEAGVQLAIVSLPDLDESAAISRFAKIIEAFA
ncbi:MAG: TIGR03560 family F420-dependent LLM class oxidoreductase [Acidimicrobiia bacterium]|nr:TIGR03560 family F420-dependent LLM class oxidoreductase [Acidimicrobiia bacterium]